MPAGLILPCGKPFSVKMPIDGSQRAELLGLRQMEKNQEKAEMQLVIQSNIPGFDPCLYHLLPILLLGKSLHCPKPQFYPLKKDTTLFRQGLLATAIETSDISHIEELLQFSNNDRQL